MNTFERELLQLFEANLIRKDNLAAVVWIKKDGTEIRFEDMSTDHLINSMQMIDKNITILERKAAISFGYSGGEMAKYYAQMDGDKYMKKVEKLNVLRKNIREYLSYKL